tara:strand:- start:259 stop:543 length:285 start_codon:yes stop_codon:yes gene_type:complete
MGFVSFGKFKCFNMNLIKKIKDIFVAQKISTMKTGTVKFFNNTKGFGFIQSKETNEEIFVHQSGLIDDIRENDEVLFDTTQGKKGINAINVKLA